jgi:amphi-Trp domain-containing protein
MEMRIKKSMDTGAAVAILEDLVRSFKDGTVCIQSGGEFVTLKPAGNIEVQIEAAEKKGRQKLVIEMGWREVVSKNGAEDILKISAKEPEITDEDVKAETEKIVTAADRIISEAVAAAGASAAEALKEADSVIETKDDAVYQNM